MKQRNIQQYLLEIKKIFLHLQCQIEQAFSQTLYFHHFKEQRLWQQY